MKKILLGITGSVAAKLTPKLAKSIVEVGYEIRIVTTQSSLYFWNPKDVIMQVLQDADEWPGEIYIKDQPVLHIELRDWADAFLIAPLTANTLAKISNGICDNLLTTVAKAWVLSKPMLIAPAMNTQMWLNPITKKHLADLKKYYRTQIIYPINKKLACGEEGPGAMAELSTIMEKLNELAP